MKCVGKMHFFFSIKASGVHKLPVYFKLPGWLLYAPSDIIFFLILCSAQHSVYRRFVCISEQTAIISLYSIN
jgi:hypothetical protein